MVHQQMIEMNALHIWENYKSNQYKEFEKTISRHDYYRILRLITVPNRLTHLVGEEFSDYCCFIKCMPNIHKKSKQLISKRSTVKSCQKLVLARGNFTWTIFKITKNCKLIKGYVYIHVQSYTCQLSYSVNIPSPFNA